MKTSLDCLVCYLRQALRVARLQGCSPSVQHEVVREVAALLPSLNLDETPPANAIDIYRTISEVTGDSDPYEEVKKTENQLALERLPALREEVREAENPLSLAIGYAIAGNIIDYGAASRFDLKGAMLRAGREKFIIDCRAALLAKVDSMAEGDQVVYLTDNCGEVVYDSLVIELLAQRGLQVTVAVRGGPIINDALHRDAIEAGLDTYARIISNGAVCPGTPLPQCSPEFVACFEKADLVISKGQGNFETLSEIEREVFFLLTVKCGVVGKHLAEISGTDPLLIPGKGEIIVFRTGYRQQGHTS